MKAILPEPDQLSETEDLSEKLLTWWNLIYTACLNFWWIILLCLAAGVGFQLYQFSQEKPSYYSRAELIMTGRLISQEKVEFQEFEMLETQVALLTSNRLRERAYQSMSVFYPEIEQSWVSISSFIREGTTIFVVEARGASPDYTQKFLDSLIKEYSELRKEMRTQTSNDVLVSRTDQLQKVEEEIESLEAELVEFQRKNNLMFIQEQSSSAGSEMASIQNEIVQLQTQLRMLQTLPLEQVLVEVANNNLAEKPQTFFDSNRYLQTKAQINRLESSLAEFSLYLKPKHPKRINLEQSIVEQRRLLEIHQKSVQEEIDQLKSFLIIKIENLQKVAQEWQDSALDMSRLNAEHDRLLSKIERTRTLYLNLVNTIQSIDLNAGEAQNRIEIHEHASTPSEQKPNLAKALLTGGLMGVTGAAGILIIINLLDNRLKSLEDFSKYSEIPPLAAFPEYSQLTRENSIEVLNDEKQTIIQQGMQELQSSFFINKQFQQIGQIFLVTSSTPDEGKSTTSTALCSLLVNHGFKTLLIDADMHRGKLHQVFKTAQHPGLSTILDHSEVELFKLIQKTEIENLSFLPCGIYKKDPGPLLSAESFSSTIKGLQEQYDYIILDTPPIIASGDALILSQLTDYIIFCVRANKTSHRQIKYSFNKLSSFQEKLSGLVLTFSKKKSSRYYDYYENY